MPAPNEPTADAADEALAPLVARFVLGLLVMCSLGAVAGHFLRKPAEAMAFGFVERFGVGGMAFGTLLADGFYFPVPPQFYMLVAVASKTRVAVAFPAIAAASVLAGVMGYQLARWASHVRWLAARTERYRRLLNRAFARKGYRAALLATLLPVPYSMLCTLAGLSRLPGGFVALLGAYRVPKLLCFYGIVYFGWSLA